MKKTTLYIMFTLVAGFFLADVALAGSFVKKQAAQQKRIQQGIRQGRLTKSEVRDLQKEQRKIRKVRNRFLADGVLGKKERRKLAALQKHANRHIKRLKQNPAVRPRHRAKQPKSGIHYRGIAAGQSLSHSV